MKAMLLALFAVLLLTPATRAQTEKGNYMLGGTTNLVGGYPGALPNQLSLGFGANKLDTFQQLDYTNINFSSNGGYFVSNGLMLGLNLSAFHSNNTLKTNYSEPVADITEKYTYTTFAIAPFARYYFNQGRKVQYFGEGRVGLAIQKVDVHDIQNQALLGAKTGVAIFLNKKVALDFFYDFSGTFSEIKINGAQASVFDSYHGFGFGFDVFL